LADQSRKASREGRPAEAGAAPQFAKGPGLPGPFVDQLKRLADVRVGNCA
jgi:hypothetical protein